MQSVLIAAELAAGTPAERIAAIDRLSGSLDPAVRALLGQVQNDANAEPEVRAAAAKAIEKIEFQRAWLDAGLAVFQGISLGSILLLAAIGLAITFSVMGVINMAHGEMIMLGTYSAFVVQEAFRVFLPPSLFDLYLIAAIPVAFMVAAVVGMAMERSVIRYLYNRPLETLLATWGISLILQQAVRSVFGATNREVANPNWMSGGFEIIGGVVLTYNRLCIIVFCLIVLALVMRSKLLVLDEPTEGIQPSIIKDIGRVIADLAAAGEMAIVLVEQYFEFARDLADRFAVMDRGEVVVSGVCGEMDEASVRRTLTV